MLISTNEYFGASKGDLTTVGCILGSEQDGKVAKSTGKSSSGIWWRMDVLVLEYASW